MLLHQIHDNYPNEVKMVFKHYPLSFHPLADVAHMASIAAHEQGKFWEMNDKIFGIGSPKETISRDNLLKYAREIGLDMKKFEATLQREEKLVVDAALAALKELGKEAEGKPLVEGVKPVSRGKIMQEVKQKLALEGFDAAFKKQLGTKSAIDQDMALADKLGTRGTPNFIVNGWLLKGAKPYEEFRKIIDEELKKKGVPVPATAGDPPKPYLVPQPPPAPPAPAQSAPAKPAPAPPAPAGKK